MKKIEFYKWVNNLFHKIGLDFRRFPTPDMRNLITYLNKNDINMCLDVGANIGQYATLLRKSGFKGEILSFEPQSKAFYNLQKRMKSDPFWKGFNFGMGDFDGPAIINISKNSVSSSIFDFAEGDLSLKASPASAFVDKENILVKRIDTFIKEHRISDERLFLKIDAQGFESKILEGSGKFLDNVYALELELSCFSLYKGEKLFDEMKSFIESKGFYLSSLQSGFTEDESGMLLQVESIFLKKY